MWGLEMPELGLTIVARRLREAREKKGLSQKALGIAAGIDEFRPARALINMREASILPTY